MRLWTLATAIVVLTLVGVALRTGAARRPAHGLISAVETRPLLGTWVTLTVAAEDRAAAQAHLRAAFDHIAQLERVLSAHSPDSELAAVNRRAAEAPVVVSDDLYRALRAGVTWHARSGGAFDITIAPVVELWGFYQKRERVPVDDELDTALDLVDYRMVVIDETEGTVFLSKPGMSLDLGGAAKGYAVD